jgi:hypothetical protein
VTCGLRRSAEHRWLEVIAQGVAPGKYLIVSQPMDSSNSEFLRQEYFRLQETVESFDERALTIKSWSITLGMGGIGAAFLEGHSIILLLSGLAALLFWLTEGFWKSFQQAYYPRIQHIEVMTKEGRSAELSSPFISSAWMEAWKRDRVGTLIRVLFWPHVAVPHALVAIFGIALWFWNRAAPFIVEK